MRTKKQSHNRSCVVRAVCSLRWRGGNEILHVYANENQSYDRFAWQPRGRVNSCQFRTPPLGYLPEFAALKAHSTPHGPRPGLSLALWSTRGSPACPAAVSRRKDPGPEEKETLKCEKSQLGKVILPDRPGCFPS